MPNVTAQSTGLPSKKKTFKTDAQGRPVNDLGQPIDDQGNVISDVAPVNVQLKDTGVRLPEPTVDPLANFDLGKSKLNSQQGALPVQQQEARTLAAETTPAQPSQSQIELAQGVGQLPALTAEQQAAEQAQLRQDLQFSFQAGRSAALKGAVAGATTGALAGVGITAGTAGLGAPSVPVLAAGGFLSGYVGGFIVGSYAEMNKDASQNTLNQADTLRQAEKYLKLTIDGVNKGLIDPITAQQQFNNQLAKIDAAERSLKYQTLIRPQDDSENRKILNRIQNFNDISRAQAIARMQEALLVPDPNKTYTTIADTQELSDIG